MVGGLRLIKRLGRRWPAHGVVKEFREKIWKAPGWAWEAIIAIMGDSRGERVWEPFPTPPPPGGARALMRRSNPPRKSVGGCVGALRQSSFAPMPAGAFSITRGAPFCRINAAGFALGVDAGPLGASHPRGALPPRPAVAVLRPWLDITCIIRLDHTGFRRGDSGRIIRRYVMLKPPASVAWCVRFAVLHALATEAIRRRPGPLLCEGEGGGASGFSVDLP